ncbi:MAG: hypothetical protein JRJ85_03065 [Deltaproteobacteria bacterium]|nr:hypothetical protein [Deltaproteobacteria bacterium]
MEIFYKPPFRKFVKKQSRPFQLIIEDEFEKIINHFEIGEAKRRNDVFDPGELKSFKNRKPT